MQIKINSLISPFIDTLPRFSWSLPSFAEQVAYTLTVATDERFENPVFSVREESDERANVRHDMKLLPHTKYFVRVCAELFAVARKFLEENNESNDIKEEKL